MSDILLLDSGPLGLITQPQRSHEVIAITDWLKDCLGAGARVLVPAIVYYEIKRELLRANKTIGIARRLDAFVNATPDRYVPRTHDALRFAAELWVVGRPTADVTALDIDVLLAAQARRMEERRLLRQPIKNTFRIPLSPTLERHRSADVCQLVRRGPALPSSSTENKTNS